MLYDSASLRRFVGVDLGCEEVPDVTTLLKFRHLLEDKKLGEQLFAKVGRVLQGNGMTLKTGTIVDATIINAPSSTRRFAYVWNMCSRWSSSCGDLRKCAIAVWQKCHADLHGISLGEYLFVAPAFAGTGAPIVGESRVERPEKRPKGQEIAG